MTWLSLPTCAPPPRPKESASRCQTPSWSRCARARPRCRPVDRHGPACRTAPASTCGARHLPAALAAEDLPVVLADRDVAKVALLVVVVHRNERAGKKRRQRPALTVEIHQCLAWRTLRQSRPFHRQRLRGPEDLLDHSRTVPLTHARAQRDAGPEAGPEVEAATLRSLGQRALDGEQPMDHDQDSRRALRARVEGLLEFAPGMSPAPGMHDAVLQDDLVEARVVVRDQSPGPVAQKFRRAVPMRPIRNSISTYEGPVPCRFRQPLA